MVDMINQGMQGNQNRRKISDLTVEAQTAIIDDNFLVNLKISSPSTPAARAAASIICVLDISGSMDTEATQGGAVESDGFSRLDLVKHSVNTIINSLSENDTFGIVTFSDLARVDFDLAEMNQANKDKAGSIVSSMKTEGSTNLWDGIKLGLELSKNQKCKGKNTFVLVLSDGEPNQHPPNGELATAQEYIASNPLTASMSMFGYGYSLDTNLLLALSELGGGCFGYIPDCSMIGTVFINFLSSALSSFSPKLQARIRVNKNELQYFNGCHTNSVCMGPIQYGVTRNCLLKFKELPKQESLGELQIFFDEIQRQTVHIKLSNKIEGNQQSVRVQKMRNEHIIFLEQARKNASADIVKCAENCLSHLERMKNLQSSFEKSEQLLDMLIRDIESDNSQEGQVMIALSKQEYWKKWGAHYFAALKIAQANQMCTNFKDPGIQVYGGGLFKQLQNTFDTVFINLAPPIPSIQKYDSQGNLHVVSNMNSYYDYEGGCIDGDCLAELEDGSKKRVKQLKAGDRVMSMGGPVGIKCVIETKVNKVIEVVKFAEGLVLTKYHPIYINNSWCFPLNETPTVKMHIQSYYNFVLNSHHSMIVNGIACITLGHGFQGKVAQHSYFGTNLIIEDLQRIVGWETGRIQLTPSSFKRSPSTHEVIGIIM